MDHSLHDTAHEKEINQLVESRFDVNSQDPNGITLLHKIHKER